MRHRGNGLSLVETVLALGLAALVLTLVAKLLIDLGRVTRRADNLSWKVVASSMLDQVELDAHSAINCSLPRGGATASSVQFTVRDVASPLFLPEEPDSAWSLDSPALNFTVEYRLEERRLKRSRGSQEVALGAGDTLEAQRLDDGRIVISLTKDKDEIRREVRTLCLASLEERP